MLTSSLKQQIEAQLAERIPAALSPRSQPKTARQPFASVQLNELLNNGVPVGAITEVHGAMCSGRTSLALSLASAVTAGGNVAAWVDVNDTMDPEAAAICGVDLDRLLWVRCGAPGSGNRSDADHSPGVDETTNQGGTSPGLVAENHKPRPVGNGGCGSPHPRGEGKGMAEAIDSLLQAQPRSAAMKQRREQKIIGTPGAPNRNVGAFVQATRPDATADKGGVSHSIGMVLDKAASFPSGKVTTGGIVPPSEIVPTGGALFGRQVERKVSCGSNRMPGNVPHRPALPFPSASPYREEQVATDRQPSRRLKQSTAVGPQPNSQPTFALRERKYNAAAPCDTAAEPGSWAALDQALRVVDLLLQTGGFSLLVLDLGSVPATMVWRIPLATWFRFRAGCERSRASLLVVSQHPCAKASADLTIAMEFGGMQSAGGTVATGNSFHLKVEQQRRNSNADMPAANNVVPFRKPARSTSDPHLGGRWTVGAHWSIRA